MGKEEIFNYVMETPGNTNPNVLRSLLDSEANSNKFIVTLTPTSEDFSGTMDKTVAEINAAYEAGQEIWFKALTSASTSVEIPLAYWATDTSADYHGFSANIVQVAANMLIVAYVSSTSDGTEQTYSTKVYSLTPAS